MTAPLPLSLSVFLAQATEAPAPASAEAPATNAPAVTNATTGTAVPATTAAPPPPGTPPPPSLLSQFVPFLFIAVIFYFILIRPQKLRAKQQAELIASLKSGDEVLTNAGIYGTVTNVNPEKKTVTVRIADNVKVIMARDSVATVLNKPAAGTATTAAAPAPAAAKPAR